MCGILLEHNQRGEFAPGFRSRLDLLEHRGKDQASVHHYPTCRVGFRRLAITDRGEQQPGAAHGWATYLNGEIYNYKELGYQGSECEVLAQGFVKEGTEFVKRLNGMFVIVAVCGADVYVFRDRAGQKPFYYFKTRDGGIVGASEIKPLLEHPDYRFKQSVGAFSVNQSAKLQWLTFNNIFTDETLFDGIYKLEKGTVWHLNTNLIEKYWRWQFKPEPMNYQEAVMQVRQLVVKAVSNMTPKEVPFGSLLSGGVDSGIIAALLPDCPVFTAGYNGGDERALAELTNKSKHYQIVFNRVTDFTDTILHLEDLRVGASWSNYGLFELASKFCKVIFDGSGADELFSGYSWRYEAKNYWDVVNRTWHEKNRPIEPIGHCLQIFEQVFPVDTLEERYRFDAEHFLEAVLLVEDRMSMAHTVETRQPFLDNDLVDFALTLPNDFKQGKRILKDAFGDLLHIDILTGKKRGWTSPDWFEGEGNQAKRWSEAALQEWNKLFNFVG